MRSSEIREALFERIADPDEDVREEAAVGLRKRQDLRLLPALRGRLHDEVLKVRVAEAASALLGLAEDPEEWKAEDYKRALDDKFGKRGPDRAGTQ
jgi:HEAT repeat protein